ncbi:MAG: hypothetical protein KBT04_00890, partial [Bacteroidales bacterium]|nr:hypothetical protein [Candidatus Colimorpha onthohippi]
YNAWIDLFGWGTSGYHAPNDLNNRFYMPYSIASRNISVPNNTNGYGPSIDRDDLNLTGKSSNYDWGVYNAITNGGNNPGLWRLLTNDEWQYLFCYRRHAVDKYAMATVGAYRGLVVLPESWILPAGCTYQSGCNNGYLTNVYSPSQWSDMEDAGALFLPAAGARYDTTVSSIAQNGYYWSSTYYDQNSAYLLLLESGRVSTGGYNRSVGRSVRLVQNVDGETLPCETYGDTTITAIDSLVWYSNTYYTSGDYERRLVKSNHMSCDSVVVLHLTIRSALGVDAPKGHETIGVRAAKGSIVVDGAANHNIKVYDVTGRVVASDASASQHTTFQVPSVGAYIVKISDRPSQKVVVTSR